MSLENFSLSGVSGSTVSSFKYDALLLKFLDCFVIFVLKR